MRRTLVALVLLTLVPERNLDAESDGIIELDALAVEGVQLSSLRSQVRETLGEPRSVRRGRDTEMGVGRWEAMEFGGLVVEVTVPEPFMLWSPPNEPYVFRYSITGSRWTTKAGIRIGNTRKQVLARLGLPSSESKAGDDIELRYRIRGADSLVVVLLREGRVVSISVAEDWS